MEEIEAKELLSKKISGESPTKSSLVNEAVKMIKEQQLAMEKFKEDIEIKNNHIEILSNSNREYQQALDTMSTDISKIKEENELLRSFIQAIDTMTLHSNPLPNINKLLDTYFDR